jgi:signal transduction histidine kinase
MARIKQIKQRELNKFNQIVLLDENGHVVESCDSIFSISALPLGQSVLEWSPFMESIFPALMDLSPENPEMRFTKLEKPFPFLAGYYDFTFSRVVFDGTTYILWSIYDYTPIYKDFLQYQQKRNELEIHRQLLEKNNRNLKHQKDILDKKNVELQQLAELHSNFYKKFSQDVLSPVNVLEGIVLILSNIVEENHQDYISALHGSTRYLKSILQEMETIASVQDGELRPKMEIFDLHQLAENICADASLLDWGNDVGVFLEIEEDVPKNVNGDEKRIRHILFSLILNLHRTGGEGKIDVRVAVGPKDGDQINIHFFITKIRANPAVALNGNMSEHDTLARFAIVRTLIEFQKGQLHLNVIGTPECAVFCSLPMQRP